MYFLSKLLPLLILPLGLGIFSLIFFYKKLEKKHIFMIIFSLWTFSIGFVADLLCTFVELPWQRIDENDAPSADAIVVLSTGGRSKAPGKYNIYEWGDPDRYFAGISLFKNGKAPKLFFTAGTSPYGKKLKDEGTLYKEHAISLGIPSYAISTTSKVVNTAEEAIAIRRNLNHINSSSEIILMTSAFHMKRAKRLFERQGFVVYPFPVDFKSSRVTQWQNPYNWIPNSGSLNRSSIALREILGRIIYRSW